MLVGDKWVRERLARIEGGLYEQRIANRTNRSYYQPLPFLDIRFISSLGAISMISPSPSLATVILLDIIILSLLSRGYHSCHYVLDIV